MSFRCASPTFREGLAALLTCLCITAGASAAVFPDQPSDQHLRAPEGESLPPAFASWPAGSAAGWLTHPDDQPSLGDGASEDRFGAVIAVSGDTAIVGAAPAAVGTTPLAGAAYVFVRQNGQWRLQQRLHAQWPESGALFGWSVAIDGDTAIIGAPRAQGAGAAHVFTRMGTLWTEQAVLRADQAGATDFVGVSAAVRGDCAVVGAAEDSKVSTGSAYIFRRTGSSWSQQTRLVAPDAQVGDVYGVSLALSADTLLVGAPFADRGTMADTGAVYVYEASGSDWNLQAKLAATEAHAGDQFGNALALFQDTALIGAWAADTAAGTDAGAAYAYERSAGTWSAGRKLAPEAAAAGDYFGVALALDADRAFIGAFADDTDAGNDSGSVHAFARAGLDWQPQARLQPADAQSGDHAGASVAIAGNTVLLGSHQDDTDAGPDAGTVTEFAYGAGAWQEQARLSAGNGAAQAGFGQTLAMSGDTAIVSASEGRRGLVYVFVRQGGPWLLQARLQASEAQDYDGFGLALALDGDTALVAAPMSDVPGAIQAGAVYVFVRSGSTWTQQAQLVAPNAGMQAFFGRSVALSGDAALIGAPFSRRAGVETGSAYVFRRSGTRWAHEAQLIGPAQSDEYIGWSVAIASDTAFLGAPRRDRGALSDAGAVFVFRRSAGLWGYDSELVAGTATASAQLGTALALDGQTVLAGAPFDLEEVHAEPVGAVFVFQQSTGGAMVEQARLRADNAAAWDGFGAFLALAGDHALVGNDLQLQFPPLSGRDAGMAYRFVRAGAVWSQQRWIVPADGRPGDRFGTAVALSADQMLVSAPGKESTLTEAANVGVVYSGPAVLADSLFRDGFE